MSAARPIDIFKDCTRRFTRADVLKVTGLTPQQLDSLLHRDMPELRRQKPGRGRPALWRAADVLDFYFVAALIPYLPVVALRAIIKYARERAAELREGNPAEIFMQVSRDRRGWHVDQDYSFRSSKFRDNCGLFIQLDKRIHVASRLLHRIAEGKTVADYANRDSNDGGTQTPTLVFRDDWP